MHAACYAGDSPQEAVSVVVSQADPAAPGRAFLATVLTGEDGSQTQTVSSPLQASAAADDTEMIASLQASGLSSQHPLSALERL